MGYYEAIDYTKERLEAGQRRAVVRTYMAHHHGMSLVALNNCLNDNIMQTRFHGDPRVQAAELLLQERSPHLVPLDRPPEEHRVEETPGRIVQSHVRRYVTPAHGHAALASAVERIVERHADERGRQATRAGATSPSRAGGKTPRAMGGARSATCAISRHARGARMSSVLVGRISAERPRRRQLRGDVRA